MCSFSFLIVFNYNTLASKSFSIMASVKYDVPLLDRNIRFSLWQVNMKVILAHIDLDDVVMDNSYVDPYGRCPLSIVECSGFLDDDKQVREIIEGALRCSFEKDARLC